MKKMKIIKERLGLRKGKQYLIRCLICKKKKWVYSPLSKRGHCTKKCYLKLYYPKRKYRICTKCKKLKSFQSFYVNRENIYGITIYCKKCFSQKNESWRKANIEKARERLKKWRNGIGNKKYYKSIRKWQLKNPKKNKAHAIVAQAIKKGKLKKLNCKICNKNNTHAHHNNYNKALEVEWLCPLHHRRRHLKIK